MTFGAVRRQVKKYALWRHSGAFEVPEDHQRVRRQSLAPEVVLKSQPKRYDAERGCRDRCDMTGHGPQ